MFAAFGFLFNMLTVFALYLDTLCSQSYFWIMLSFNDYFNCLFIREIQISTSALNLHMSDMDVHID